jgi:hypothetical protein
MSEGRCINQNFFMKIQSSIHIILTKHQQLKRYKIIILNTLQCIFEENKSRRIFTFTKIIYD